MSIVDEILNLLKTQGTDWYGGERVTQSEHAWQTARLAEEEGASESLILASLLHDYGHLLHGESEDLAEQGVDDCHEELGRRYLSKWFGPSITEPIVLHVDAKRYLCAVDPSYHEQLSPASQLSLSLQGGPMSQEEIKEFESNSYYQAAVRLRRWDDLAKVEGGPTPDFERYRPMLNRAINSSD